MDPNEKDADFLSHKQDFAYFLAPDNGDSLYGDKIEDMVSKNKKRLTVNLRDINQYDTTLRRNILQSPMEYIPSWEEALKDFIDHSQFTEKQSLKYGEEYKIGIEGSFGGNRTTPQRLMSSSIGQMVCVEGIVTKVSLVRPKVKETVHYCQATGQFITQKYRDSTSLLGAPTSNTYPTTDSNGNNLTTEFGLSTFSDHQKVYIQDMPERTEPGSMPQTIECILDNDLVDCCKPGDRVQMIGIYRALSSKRASGSVSGRFATVILTNNVVKIGIGSKKTSEISTLSASEIKAIKKIAKKKSAFDLLARSIVPSIHGHDYIKKAILLQLFGGVAKHLDNGTRLRGDVNILMVGDPSCGKSQLLRGVMNIGRLVINTTGRGSSGVGLTAAVTTDKDSGDKKLEAGAMVLADGGTVCIDEFDKMTDVDRTAIHEVMEQQTVTIAKAGIHCSLNARCSVIAAANPVYGMYDRYKKPHENIGLPDSLLSRFDLLFIVLDKIDTKIDRAISDHVLKMHLTPHNIIHEDNNNDDDEDDNDANKEDGDVEIYSKQRVNKKQKILTIEFIQKYIDFAKKQYKPILTDEACEEIANQYAELREEERNQTLPITARCLETIIRLSTAHAKLRLSKKIEINDVNNAMEVLQFALTNDADPQKRAKNAAERPDGDDDDDDDEDGENDANNNRPKRRKRKRREVDDNEDDDDVQMGDDEQDDSKMAELNDNGEQTKGNKKKKRKRKHRQNDDNDDDDDDDDEMQSGQQKKQRTSKKNVPSNINSENLKSVTKYLSNHFRLNRVGRINKSDLLKKLNEENNINMNQQELESVIKHLHDENKIFYIDPMIHQL